MRASTTDYPRRPFFTETRDFKKLLRTIGSDCMDKSMEIKVLGTGEPEKSASPTREGSCLRKSNQFSRTQLRKDRDLEDMRKSGVHELLNATAKETFSREASLRRLRTGDMTSSIVGGLQDKKVKDQVEKILRRSWVMD
jgi:hypothetical protein